MGEGLVGYLLVGGECWGKGGFDWGGAFDWRGHQGGVVVVGCCWEGGLVADVLIGWCICGSD